MVKTVNLTSLSAAEGTVTSAFSTSLLSLALTLAVVTGSAESKICFSRISLLIMLKFEGVEAIPSENPDIALRAKSFAS